MSTITAKANTTIAFTDGACKGNPGVGGWGAYLIFADGRTQDLFGGEDNTTNNRMELMGAIQALQHTPTDQQLEIWTDSSYVKNGITQWIEGWKQKGWKTANKKPVANQDLWQQLDQLTQARSVSWHWVKGHNGHAGNEKADELANQGVISIIEPHTNTDTNHGQNVSQNTQNMQNLNTNHQATQPVSATDDWLENDPLGFGLSDVPETHTQQDKPSYIEQEAPNIAETIEPTALSQTDTIEPSTVEFDGDTSRANPYFVPLLPAPKHRYDNDRQLIMDTETTGLDAQKGDRIIEVGIVELVGRRFTGEKLHVYINPQRGLQEDALRVHGISEAFLADKPTFDKVAQKLYDFMDGAEVIAHNAPFDIGFLSMEFNKVGLTDFSQRIKVTDTLVLAKQQYPGQKNTLDALVKRLNVGKQDRTFHGALLDAEILAEVYLAMTGGQVSLAIDEETPTEDGGSHANFAHLSSLLLKASSDPVAHQRWIESLADSYPNLHTVWNT